jgi:hypothetical protein
MVLAQGNLWPSVCCAITKLVGNCSQDLALGSAADSQGLQVVALLASKCRIHASVLPMAVGRCSSIRPLIGGWCAETHTIPLSSHHWIVDAPSHPGHHDPSPDVIGRGSSEQR